MREKMRLFNINLSLISPEDCLRSAVENETYTILALSEKEVDINDVFITEAEIIKTEALLRNKIKNERLFI